MSNNDRKNYQKFLETWGEQSQIMMAIEEMSELTKELCKYIRYNNWEKEKVKEIIPNVNEEIADVINCVEQLKLIFDEEEIERIRKAKIKRTLKRVKEQ